jgi:NTE family protein
MTTAFVLSGGGSLGAVQVGMMLALSERGIAPDLLVGTSVGALNAAYLAGDPGPRGTRSLAALWSGLQRRDIFPLPHLFQRHSAGALRALAGRHDHLLDPAPLRRLVASHVPFTRLEDAPWPVAVVATEVTTGLEVVLAEGDAVDAVVASASLPGVFPPVDMAGHLLMDGGVVNHTPISVAAELGADRVIVLPTGYACALETAPRSALAMVVHAFTLATQRRLVDDVRRLQGDLDLRVVPPLCPVAVSPVEFALSAELIDRARRATRRWLDADRVPDQARDLAPHRHGDPAAVRRLMPTSSCCESVATSAARA